MNCSACRTRIGPLQDGELSARDARLVEAHLASCAACNALAGSMAAVESTLIRLAPIEPRTDFTLAVMAGIAAMPAPQRQPARLWWLVVADVVLWVALGALTALGVIRWKLVAGASGAYAAKVAVALGALYDVAQHFHMTAVLVLGVGIEVAFIALLAVVGRRYLPHVRATFSGVLS